MILFVLKFEIRQTKITLLKARAEHTKKEHFYEYKRNKEKQSWKNQKCTACSWKGSSLGEHWKSEHPDLSLPFLCHSCNHATYSEAYLKIHIWKHHTEKKFKCDICGKESKLVSDHEKHIKSHTDEKDFHCDKCTKGFRNRFSLKAKNIFSYVSY